MHLKVFLKLKKPKKLSLLGKYIKNTQTKPPKKPEKNPQKFGFFQPCVKEEGGGEEPQGGGSVRQPCILIFDSLAGSSKARTCQTLRYRERC
jgi:hypothetical protein